MEAAEIEREFWRCKESPLYFLTHYVKVKTKKGDIVPFMPNVIQMECYKALKERFFKPYQEIEFEDGSSKAFSRFQEIRMIIVKYRQIGISTLIVALILHDCIFWAGTEAAIFLHKDEYSKKMLGRLKDMMLMLPPWLKPKANEDDLDSKSELYFSAIRSRISVGTPGKTQASSGDKGRSETLQDVMISEMPRYPYQEDFLQGITAAAKQGNIFIESTPLKRGDLFHQTFKAGLAGENEWLALFYPWFMDPANSLPVHTDEERAEIQRTLTDPEKELLREQPHLTEEQIKWRRFTILNDYMGNERRFCQEYPENPERAFAATGFNYFDDPEFEIKVISTRFKNSNDQPIIFRPAIKGHFHCLGVDPAQGLGGNHDYSVISIIDVDTQEQVFEWRNNTLGDKLLPAKIYELWKQYPGVVVIENNDIGHGVLAVCRIDPRLNSDKCFDYMVYRTSRTIDGWRTGSNKPSMLSEFYCAVKDGVRCYVQEDSMPLKPVGLRLSSPTLIQEMGIYVSQDGELGAVRGTGNHDDCVMAAALAWQMLPYAPGFRRKYLQFQQQLQKEALANGHDIND